MSRPDSRAHRTSTLGQRKRLQQLVVRVGTLPMAAALALGATVPWAAAQTVITPLSGAAATQTLVTRAPEGVTVTTGTLRDGNAFNNFSAFQVGAGDRVNLVVPQGANWLVNVVRDARVQVDGNLQGRLANGAVGGNLLFIDRHGFAVGPQGSVQAGRLVFAAPSTAFVDGLLADGPGLSSARVSGVLGGAFDRSDTGAVRIDGSIETTDGVQLMAGQGAGSAHGVSISGRVSVAGRLAGSAVNLGDLRSLAPVVVRDGVIDITTPGDLMLNGKLLADGSHWSDAGAVRVVAGGNISLGSQTLVSASAGEGSGAQGGTVSLFAHGSASNAAGAALAARGDGFGAGGFIEFSAAKSVQIGGLTLDAGSDQGQAGLAYIDPQDLTVTGSLHTNGASLSLDASKTLQVNTGVTLNTRRVNGATASSSGVSSAATALANDPLTRSVGNSGNITLTAPSITVQAGATLDASVINEGGTTYQAGDITLTATQTSTWETLISLADANASIDVAGTLTGRNVTLEASIESAASFGGTSGSIQQEAINLLLGDLPFAASLSYVEAKGDATITVRPTAVLAATGNITLTALADRSVSVETEAAGSGKANLSAGFARVLGSTTIDVQEGASFTADGDIALVAASKTSVIMASSAAGETDEESGAANVASIVFAGSMSDVTTSVNVARGASLGSGGDVLLQAFHSGNYDTTAEVTVYGGGTAGVVGALSLQNSTTSVTVGGTVNAQGHVSLVAMNASAKNAITASAANASEEEEESALAGLPESLEYSQDAAGEAAEAQLLDSFTAMTEAFSASSDEASGGTPSETKSPALRLAGAMTWSQSSHTTRASLAAGGVINAGGDAVVDAQTLVGQLQSVAMAETTSATDDKEGTKTSLAVAFNYADHSFTTKALVGAGAAITAGHVAVNASTDVPQFYTAGLPLDLVGAPVEWGTFTAAYETFMAGTDPFYDGFNTRVGATSSATNLAAAGAVSLSFMTNDTRAWVDTGAQITSTVADGVAWSYGVREVGFESDLVAMLTPSNTYSLDKDLGVLGDFVAETRDAPSGPDVEEISFSRSFDGAVVVRAENHVQTLHLAGGTGPEAGGSGSSVGGTFSMVSRDNTAVAGVADSAVIRTHRLDVAAETMDWVLSLSPTSGQGAGVAANGIASLNRFSETTRASISREARITADAVSVNAQLSLGVIAVTGAVTQSENSGVGIGVAMKDMVGNTQAYIGDNDTDGGGADTLEGVAGYVKTSRLAVQARSDGMVIAVGVAGAAAGRESPSDKSANKNLGEKAGTDSADTQAQLDANDSVMAPLEEASAPIKGEGTDQAAAAEPEAGKPPSFSIAGAGANRGSYLAQGKSSLVQVAGRRSTDSESDINKNFANGSITQSQRNTQLAALAARRGEPVVYYDAEDNRLKVASTEVTGGLVEVVGSVINTGGGVIRALDGYARFNIDNQTTYGMDLQGLDTGGDVGVVRITDLNRPVFTDGRISAYEVTTYERNALGAFRSTTTAGRGAGAAVLRSSGSTLASPSGNRLATFSYAPVTNSTYVWSAGYEFNQEKRYWYQKSSSLWGAINLGSIKWNSIDIVTKDATAMPEGIYVTTSGAPSQNFTMSAQTFVTDSEQETYYRSWKKCGPLCFKKTYYVDYRTEVGKKDVFTQRVRADHPIAVEMIGYGTGLIDVKSNSGVRLSGNITNDSGLVSIDSINGSIEQLSGGTAVTGNDLRFYAQTGMGSEGAPINVVTGTGSFTAQSDSGNISFQSLGGALRINQVSTTGKVWLLGDEDIVGVNPNTVHVIGSRIELAAPRGGIGVFNADGSVRSTLNIQTQDSPGGGITASAARGIALKQATSNLWVNQIVSNGGDVYIQAGGDLIDNNRNETRDVRTEAELLALWDAAALQGSSAEDSRQLTLRTTRSQYRRYWALRNASATAIDAATGVVTAYSADSLNAGTFQFVYSDAERVQLAQSGLTVAQIGELEAARTQEVKDLDAIYGATQYQLDDDLVIAQVNAANLLAGRAAVDALSSWSDAELQSPLPNAIFSKSSTDTQTRIEEPNVVGNRVVLRPGGKIGRDDGSVTIDLRKDGGLTTEDRLTIMAAETDDMSLDKTNWLLTVVKKDTFNVLSNRLNVNSSGFVYLGADTTDAHPTGGDAHLEQVIGAGEVRIKVSGSILNASNLSGSVIQGHKAILEAAAGSIGTALKPVTLTLTGGATPGQATLVARAQEGIWLSQTGDMRVADVYSPASVSLTASGSIIDARGERTRSIEADGATLSALGGSVGSALQPMTVKTSLGSGVNASSAVGYSIFLQGAETGLTVGRLSSGLDVDLYAAQGGLRVVGSTDARGRVDAEASGAGDFTMASGTWLRALTGDIYVAGDDVGLSQLDASRAAVVVARGALTDTSDEAVNVNVAGRGVTLTAAGSIGTTARAVDVLAKTGTKLVATTGGNAYLGSATSSLRIGQVSAVGNAVIGSDYSILDDRGTRAQAVDAANISFASGGDVGQSTSPMTVRTAVNGAVLGTVAGGSLYLKGSSGVLNVRGASAGAGQVSLNGSLAGLKIGGDVSTADGLTLSAGTQALELDASAQLANRSGSLVLQGRTITLADGASVDGGAGTVVLSATGDIQLTGIRSDNGSSGAIVVSTTGGSVLDAGDSTTDLLVSSATGGVVVSAQGSVGNTALATTAQGRSIETDAASLLVTSKADSVSLAQTSATRDVVISARDRAELVSQGSVAGTRVVSLLGDVAVSSALGGVKLTSITAGQDVTVAAAGKIELVAVTALRDIGLSSSGLGAAGVGQGLVATTLTAGRHLSIRAQGGDAQATLTSAVARSGSMDVNVGGELTMASATSSAALTLAAGGAATINTLGSSTGSVSVTAGSSLSFSTAKAVQGLTMRSIGQLTGVSATSSAGTLDIASTAGGLKLATASAATGLTLDSAGALGVSSWASTRGAASITAQGVLTLGSGKASGQVAIRSGTEVSLGTLSSTTGGITIESSHGPLTTGALTAAYSLSLTSEGAVRTGTLTSLNSSVQVESFTGSVALSTVSARTSLAVSAGSSLTLTSFTVTAGGATLNAVTELSVVRGTATGAIGLKMGGQGSLGTVTSSASTLSAQSTGGGLQFTALKAARSISLAAAGPLSSGDGVGYSLYGGTLDAGTSVDAQSTTGGIRITRLTARTASRLTTGSGLLTLSAISLLPKGWLLASTGSGKRTVPVGY